ncbi:MAG: phytanoyl-CoA dioxygenase family protein [Ilumatobacteraceae bacterium]
MSAQPARWNGSALAEDAADRFHADGYLAVPSAIVDLSDIASVRAQIASLFDLGDRLDTTTYRDLSTGTRAAPLVPEIVFPSRLAPRLLKSRAYAAAEQIACKLLGVNRVLLHFDHAIFKPALTGGSTRWHQDVFFDPQHDCPMATVWVALVNVDEHNGCMNFIPGSHRGPVYPHEAIGDHGRHAVGFDDSPAVSCPLPAGGVTVHQARTLHMTGPNNSDDVRAAWILKLLPEPRSAPRRLASQARAAIRGTAHRSAAGVP